MRNTIETSRLGSRKSTRISSKGHSRVLLVMESTLDHQISFEQADSNRCHNQLLFESYQPSPEREASKKHLETLTSVKSRSGSDAKNKSIRLAISIRLTVFLRMNRPPNSSKLTKTHYTRCTCYTRRPKRESASVKSKSDTLCPQPRPRRKTSIITTELCKVK